MINHFSSIKSIARKLIDFCVIDDLIDFFIHIHRWVFPLYYKGLKNEIQMQDLTKCSTSDDTKILCDELEKYVVKFCLFI